MRGASHRAASAKYHAHSTSPFDVTRGDAGSGQIGLCAPNTATLGHVKALSDDSVVVLVAPDEADYLGSREDAKDRAAKQTEREAKSKQRRAQQEQAAQAKQREQASREQAKRQRVADMAKRFGDGTVGGDRKWLPPVYALMASDGRPVTISFGRGSRSGESLVADGHIGMKEFYQRGRVGHDHFLKDGRVASKVDRHRFK